MSEEFVISQCSPTMAGLKTGNLFTCPISSRREFTEDLKNYNARLVPKGVRLLPLRVGEKKCTCLYVPPGQAQNRSFKFDCLRNVKGTELSVGKRRQMYR